MDDRFDSLLEVRGWMKSERNRLVSFTNWPLGSSQDPRVLAKAGFYYTGADDRVECPFCFGVLKKWKRTDDPYSEHRTHFPYCKFISGEDVGNIPLQEERMSSYSFKIQDNKHGSNLLDFTKEANRLLTFSRWPEHLSQTPENLSRAGFYHAPSGEKHDRVRCAYCQGKLYNWQTGDDPWIEHARCFPSCPYVKLCLGENVIADLYRERQEVMERSNGSNDVRKIKSPTNEMTEKNNSTNEVTGLSASPSDVSNPGAAMSSVMKSEAVQAVTEMGFPSVLIQKAVDKYNRGDNSQDLSGELLASLIFELEQENCGQLDSAKTQRSNNRKDDTSDLKASLRQENAKLRQKYMCRICFTSEVRVTFLPCGHLVSCIPCSLSVKHCPACGSAVTSTVKTYY